MANPVAVRQGSSSPARRDAKGRDDKGRDQDGRDQKGRDQNRRDQNRRDQNGRDQNGRDQNGRDQNRRDQEAQQRPDRFYGPFAGFDELFDRMVSRFLGSSSPWSALPSWPALPALPDWTKDETRDFTPPVDVEETDDAWLYELELPGVQRDDIQVELVPCELIVSGKVEERERTGVMRHQDRHTGSFEYKASIPASVDPAGVDARFDNGVLAVRVPRPVRARTRHIKIN